MDIDSDDPDKILKLCEKYGFEVLTDPVKPIVMPGRQTIYRNKTNIPRKPHFSPRKKKMGKKIKVLQRRVSRLRNKVNNLNDLIKVLKEKQFVTEDYCARLENVFSGDCAKIFENCLKNSKRKPSSRRYSEEIKHFALTLHYYSPKAYEFCR